VTNTAVPTPTAGAAGPAPDERPPEERRRDRRVLIALAAMAAAILLFTAVSIVFEVRQNLGARFRADVAVGQQIRNDAFRVTFRVRNTGTKAGRPDVCDAVLFDVRGVRAGVASVRLRTPIEPGSTYTAEAVGTVARPPVNGVVTCRGLSPQ
jgi:hypothetical protein